MEEKNCSSEPNKCVGKTSRKGKKQGKVKQKGWRRKKRVVETGKGSANRGEWRR
jgi:hypothetical protein